jgi:2-oxo-4-hydroxy-4-carboxy--5-ureidoimidazoline (OHCU) decarboxylase
VRDLPRQLSAEDLAQLFSGRTRLVERLAGNDRPLEVAEEVARELPEEEKVEALAAHPRIGEASPEQYGDEAEVLAELAELNRAYEEKFGFRFVVFVDRRPRSAIVPILRERLERTREEELETGLRELVSIARDRWIRTT